MRSSVYDTILVAKANGNLAGRKSGNRLDQRLRLLEDATNLVTTTLVNKKLLYEYGDKIKEFRNETVRAFFDFAMDHGVNSGRSTLSSADWEKAHKARWPAHDQHLIAAAIGAIDVSIYVTEIQHAGCASGIRKQFGIVIVPS